jgi:predicted RNase H-like nuclease
MTGRRDAGGKYAKLYKTSVNEGIVSSCRGGRVSPGKGLSKQSFGLLEKIRQVDYLMTPELQMRVREIHPEVSFWALNGKKPVEQSKRSVPGQAQRHKLLHRIFTDMDDILSRSPGSGFAMDDAFDALVAAWTAAEAVAGRAETLPHDPELDGMGLKMEILFPTGRA